MYIVMMQPKNTKLSHIDCYAPLAYGRDGEPTPDQLLKRGSRASMFPTIDAAYAALEETLVRATNQGCSWPKAHAYDVVECTN